MVVYIAIYTREVLLCIIIVIKGDIMQLEKFLENILETENQSVRIMINLIDTINVNEKNEQAILDFFHNIPHKLKESKKTYEYAFYTFFQHYRINENNIQYYNDYIQENYMKIDIVEKNPGWHFNEVIFTYNTLKDLIMNFQTASNKGEKLIDKENSGLKFIEENYPSFQKFSQANSKKFTQYLIKKKVFNFIQAIDYKEYKRFCEKCSLSYLDIIKEMYIKSYSECYEGYGFRGFLSHTKYKNFTNEELENVLSDISKNREYLFGNDNQFFNIKNKLLKDNENHISVVLMEFIVKENYDLALTLTKYFKNEIIEGLNFIAGSTKNNIEVDMTLLGNVMKQLTYHASRYGSFHMFSNLDNNKLNKFFNMYNMKNDIKSKPKM